MAKMAGSVYLEPDEAESTFKRMQEVIADPQTQDRDRSAARRVLSKLAGNPSTPGGVLHALTVVHDGTAKHERDWRHGGDEATTRQVVNNPSTPDRTLEAIAADPNGKLSYEAWKRLRMRNNSRQSK